MTERLPCKLTEHEKIARAREATELLAQQTRMTDAEKARSATAKAEIKTVSEQLHEAARASREGWEHRDVEVNVIPNNTDLTIETWRCDTGELVRSRPMSDDEKRRVKQPSLLKS